MKKILAVFTILAVSIFGLTGCKKNTVVNAGEPLKVLSKSDLVEFSKQDTIKIKFWHSFGQDITKELNALIEEFEEDMAAENIKIDIEAESTGGGYNGLRARINQGIKSNAIPQMALGYPDHFADYINNGIMLPLDEFINSTDPEIGLSKTEQDDYISSYWNESIFNIDGKETIVGIPFNKSSEVMYYNASAVDPILSSKGYLSENGNWEKPTWEQLWEVSQALLDKHAAGTLKWNHKGAEFKSNASTKYPVIIDSPSNFFITSSRQWGGDGKYTRVTSDGKGEVVFNNSSVVEAQNYFLNKANKNLWQLPDKLNQSFGSKLTVNLQSFISIGSTAGVKNNASTKYELKVAPYPQKSYDENAYQAVIQQGTNACILSKNSNNYIRTAAWLLIKYLTSPEKTAIFSKETGYMPVRTSALESEDYQDFLAQPNNQFYGSVSKAINSAYQQQEYFYTDPAFSGSSIIRDKVGEGIIAIYCQNKAINLMISDTYEALKKLKFTCLDI